MCELIYSSVHCVKVTSNFCIYFMQPLHHAARGEHLYVVNLLLQAGACPKKENSYGQTPADMADQDTEVRTLLSAKQIEANTHTSDN
jgi:ankyrin repeat protein